MMQSNSYILQTFFCASLLILCCFSPSIAYLFGRRIARGKHSWPPFWIRTINRCIVAYFIPLAAYFAWLVEFDMLSRKRPMEWWEPLLSLPLPFAAFFGPAIATAIVLSARDAAALPRQNICINCEYDLTGNVSGLCPECGERIEPPEGPSNG